MRREIQVDVRLGAEELRSDWEGVEATEASREGRCNLIAEAQRVIDQAHEEDWPKGRLQVELALLVYEHSEGRDRLDLCQIVRAGCIEFTAFREVELDELG